MVQGITATVASYCTHLYWSGRSALDGVRERLVKGFWSDKLLFREAIERLQQGAPLCLFYFSAVKSGALDKVCRRYSRQGFLQQLSRSLHEAIGSLDIGTVLGMEVLGGTDLILLLAPKHNMPPGPYKMAAQVQALQARTLRILERRLGAAEIDLRCGSAAMLRSAAGEAEGQFLDALRQAMQAALRAPDPEAQRLSQEFETILDQSLLTMVYQPIIDLRGGGLFGYEALTRGPAGSRFASPGELFDFATRNGSLYLLEKIARRLALQNAPSLPGGSRLFLNINPSIISDPSFRRGETRELLDSLGLSPQQIVFELTERSLIDNYVLFAKALDHYRCQGYQIALDDTGSGYSGLQALAEVQPDFIKIDMSLVKNICHSLVKRTLMETFLTFANKIGASIIAEGIETEAEMAALVELGVPYGQGYFIARPGHPAPEISGAAQGVLERLRSAHRPSRSKNLAGQIMDLGVAFPPETLTRELVAFFEEHRHLRNAAVVVGEMPIGLVTWDKLYQHLASRYGVALYLDRPVTAIMEANPLTVKDDLALEEVSQLAMHRPAGSLYDDIIVVRGRKYAGTISVQRLLDSITKAQIEMARKANPLTGLPGNDCIEEEIESRLQSGDSFAVIYADLDNFKAYNDRYGFERGDRVIRMLADIVVQAVNQRGDSSNFIGHIGGDDLIVVAKHCQAERICRAIIAALDRQIGDLYDPADKEQGYIQSYNRQGQRQAFPIMTISLAYVVQHDNKYASRLAITSTLAELKSYAKSRPGSKYVDDRRNPSSPANRSCAAMAPEVHHLAAVQSETSAPAR